MDFDLRQWLLILGPVFVIAVLLHGYLRMRTNQNQIRMKLDKSFQSRPGEKMSLDDLGLLKAELPNGGARVIRPGSEAEEDVPVLRESVDLPSIRATGAPPAASVPHTRSEPVRETSPVKDPESAARPGAKAPPALSREPDQSEAEGDQSPASKGKTDQSPKPEKFVVIYVLAMADPFPGQRLLEILVDTGLTFGEMEIFHRLLEDDVPAFSLASAVKPGTFDPATMDSFSTPGVTLFMRVHELSEPLQALEEMLVVANRIALELDGEVRDESRSVMTPQTIEHTKQSIREFQFRHSA